MASPQRGSTEWTATVVGILGIVVALLAWLWPRGTEPPDPVRAESPPAVQPSSSSPPGRPTHAPSPSTSSQTPPPSRCPGPGCHDQSPYAFDKICIQDYKQIDNKQILGSRNSVIADFTLMRSERCGTAWAKVKTDGALRDITVSLDYPGGTVRASEIDDFTYTNMALVPDGKCVSAYATVSYAREAALPRAKISACL